MTDRTCIAPHPANPPRTLGELRLCTGHHRALQEALTGPSAAEDATIDCIWGVRDGNRVSIHDSAGAAYSAATTANIVAEAMQASRNPYQVAFRPYTVVCGDGETWHAPRDYRPGGLARDWAALQLRERTIHTGEAAPYATGSTEPALPIDDRLADLRSQVLHDLDWWTGEHAEQLRVARPATRTVHQAVAWLARHIDWSAAQPFAGEYVAVLTELRARIRRAVDLPAPRRTDVGPCVEHDRGRRCPGRLFTIARDPGDPVPVVIQCDTCTAAYDSARWKRLGERLKHAGRMAA